MKWPRKSILKVFRRIFVDLGLISLGAALGFLTLAFLLAGEIYDYHDTVHLDSLPEVDAIVCLAGGRGRIAAAEELWYRYYNESQLPGHSNKAIPVLYFSGMGQKANWNALVKQFRRNK